MPHEASTALATQWKDLWNGDLKIADEIIAEDFLAHAAPLTGTGPDEIRQAAPNIGPTPTACCSSSSSAFARYPFSNRGVICEPSWQAT